MELKPMDSAHPSSRLIVAVSNVSACHISNWLIAVLGIKSLPRNQPTCAYHWFACSFVHTSRTGGTFTVVSPAVSFFWQDVNKTVTTAHTNNSLLNCFIRYFELLFLMTGTDKGLIPGLLVSM